MPPTLAALPYPQIDPVLLRLGPLEIRWYGLAYLAGFIVAFLVLRSLSRKGALRLDVDQITDVLAWLAGGVIVGGRLGWWLFYHRAMGPEPWWEPIAFWHGGMSFHGGVLGVVTALFLWCRRHRDVRFWHVIDALSLVAPIGLFFGRLANFINAELVGRESDVPWAMLFPGDAVTRHPSQLYEALLEGPALLALLWLVRRTWSPREGRITALFAIGYGLARFAVEFTRQPDVQLGFIAWGWLTMGQVLSLALVAAGIVGWYLLGRRAIPPVPERERVVVATRAPSRKQNSHR